MSTSYPRNCRYCGRRIHMRQMPHGRWVAFDFDNQPHDCRSGKSTAKAPNVAKPTPPYLAPDSARKNPLNFEDIEFQDFSNLGEPPRDPKAIRPEKSSTVKPPPPLQPSRVSTAPAVSQAQIARPSSTSNQPPVAQLSDQKASRGCAFIPLVLLVVVIACGSILSLAL